MIDYKKLKNIYLSEAEDQITGLSEIFIRLETLSKDSQSINEVMRLLHTLKGSSSSMGYKNISKLCHIMEDYFEEVRSARHEIVGSDINLLLKATDWLTQSIGSIRIKDVEAKLPQEFKTLFISPKERDDTNIDLIEARMIEDIKINKNLVQVKISTDRIDSMLRLVEELVTESGKIKQQNMLSNPIRKGVENISKNLSELQWNVMQMRLIPIDYIFSHIPRMVRDLSQSLKNVIKLEIHGSEIELDRPMIEKLNEPIIHLIRNAADHGIGVGESGTIKVAASKSASTMFLSVEDNGVGINVDAILKRAVDLSLATKGEAEKIGNDTAAKQSQFMSLPRSFNNILFNENLSTKKMVSNISGRGVGLNVVKNFMDKVGGNMEIYSPLQDGGTQVVLILPISISMIKALLVDIKGATYAIPFNSIEKSISVKAESLKENISYPSIVLDGKSIPILRKELLYGPNRKCNSSGVEEKCDESLEAELKYIVIVRTEDERVGLEVDSLLKEESLLVRPLGSMLKGNSAFSGISLLDDGTPTLIIDTDILVKNQRFMEAA